MRAWLEAGRQLLAWQSYEVRDHVASGDTVVTRMRSTGSSPPMRILACWDAYSCLPCVAHYRLAAGRIVRIEQHDCYEQPSLPEARGADRP